MSEGVPVDRQSVQRLVREEGTAIYGGSEGRGQSGGDEVNGGVLIYSYHYVIHPYIASIWTGLVQFELVEKMTRFNALYYHVITGYPSRRHHSSSLSRLHCLASGPSSSAAPDLSYSPHLGTTLDPVSTNVHLP